MGFFEFANRNMSNLMLTNMCNQKCSYCFASSYLQSDTNAVSFLSENSFVKYLDFLDRSEIDQVRLLGGEPTLHPKFAHFLNEAIKRGKNIVVFTNGLMPASALNALLKIPPECVNVLVNVTRSSRNSEFEINPKQSEILTKLGQRAHLGFTIFHLDVSGLFFLLDVISNTGCKRSVRLGLSLPSDEGNSFLSPKHYRRIAKGVMQFVRKAHEQEIKVEFDCGFVRCMFDDDDIFDLRQIGVNFGWRCNPVLDIKDNEVAVSCFPLAREYFVANALDHTEAELIKIFQDELAHFRIVGIFAECSTCPLRVTENCSGGCRSIALKRLNGNPMTYFFPDGVVRHHSPQTITFC